MLRVEVPCGAEAAPQGSCIGWLAGVRRARLPDGASKVPAGAAVTVAAAGAAAAGFAAGVHALGHVSQHKKSHAAPLRPPPPPSRVPPSTGCPTHHSDGRPPA